MADMQLPTGLKSDSFKRKPIKPWQNWGSIDLALLPFKVHASACLVIDVPPGAVLGNHDGDTFQVFNFQAGGAEKIRVKDVNTPEMSKKKGVPDEPGAREAKEFTRAWLAKGKFRMSSCGTPTFDRVVWTVERDGRTLAQDLKDAGLGR
jgi:endonuclease YncB( thermonuclease family)